MFKYVALLALVGCAAAAPKPGFLAAPAALHAAPLVATAHAVALAPSAPIATSYANTYKVSYKSPVLATAPLISAGPALTYAAPAIAHAAPATVISHGYPAPLTYAAHAPLVAIH